MKTVVYLCRTKNKINDSILELDSFFYYIESDRLKIQKESDIYETYSSLEQALLAIEDIQEAYQIQNILFT